MRFRSMVTGTSCSRVINNGEITHQHRMQLGLFQVSLVDACNVSAEAELTSSAAQKDACTCSRALRSPDSIKGQRTFSRLLELLLVML